MEQYYLKVPIPSSDDDEWEFVKVDLTRLSINVVLDIWTRQLDKLGVSRTYMRATGVESRVKMSIDTTSVREHLQEMLSQLAHVVRVQANPEVGGMINRTVVDSLARFSEVVTCLGDGKIADAQEAISTIVGELMASLSALAEQLSTQQLVSDGMLENVVHLQTEVERERQATIAAMMDQYRDYVASAQSFAKAVADLDVIERELRHVIEQIGKEFEDHRRNLSSQQAKEAVAFLQESFNVHAPTFTGVAPGVDSGTMLDMHARATTDIKMLKGMQQLAQTSRTNWRKVVEERVAVRSTEVMSASLTLAERRRDFVAWRKKMEGKPLPHEVGDGSLISAADFDACLDKLKDVNWSPKLARDRISGLTMQAMDAVRPVWDFPEQVKRELAMAEKYLDDVYERISSLTEPACVAPEKPPVSKPDVPTEAPTSEPSKKPAVELVQDTPKLFVEVKAATPSRGPQQAAAIVQIEAPVVKTPAEPLPRPPSPTASKVARPLVAIKASRFEELREIILGVAYVQTCNEAASSSVALSVILRAMVVLGVMTQDELDQYSETLTALMLDPKHCERVPNIKWLRTRFNSSKIPLLIHHDADGREVIKLTNRTRERAFALKSKRLTMPDDAIAQAIAAARELVYRTQTA